MTPTLPGPTIGVVGGGQLGRMLAEAAAPLGVELIVLDPTPDCPASLVARDQIVGDFDDPEAIDRLAERTDLLTYEIELADPAALERAGDAHDVPVHPDPATLRTIQDKLTQKATLRDAGVPVPPFVAVDDREELAAAIDRFDGVMLKARSGGYDGRGNAPAESQSDAPEAMAAIGGNAMAESFVPFVRELSVIGVKGADSIATYPVTETIHEEEILRESVSPARTRTTVRERAIEVATDVLELLEGRGVYGIELFETDDGEILVNEIAPRPHNSGHWTIEGAATSQFENHVRAVLGWPIGPTDLLAPTVTANLLGDVDEPERARLRGVGSALETPHAHLHWYGKREARPLRKMGHVTLTDPAPGEGDEPESMDDPESVLLERARSVRDSMTFRGDG